MKKLLILSVLSGILLFLFPVKNEAFTPGYMGNRFFAGYSMHLSPTISNPNKNFNSGVAALSLQHDFVGQYMLNNKNTFQISFGKYNTGFDFSEDRVLFYNPGDNNQTYSFYIGDPPYFENITGNRFNIGIKFHYDHKISPLGGYFQLDYQIISVNINYDLGNILEFYQENIYDPWDPWGGHSGLNNYLPFEYDTEEKLKGIAMTYGSQKVVFDRIMIDWGLQFAFYLDSDNNIAGFGGELRTDGNSEHSKNYLAKKAADRVADMNMISFKIGAGLLF